MLNECDEDQEDRQGRGRGRGAGSSDVYLEVARAFDAVVRRSQYTMTTMTAHTLTAIDSGDSTDASITARPKVDE